jgi:hypothetical protein
MQLFGASIEAKTLAYWKLSRAWNGVDNDHNFTFMDFNGGLLQILDTFLPNKLLQCTLNLQDALISDGQKHDVDVTRCGSVVPLPDRRLLQQAQAQQA